MADSQDTQQIQEAAAEVTPSFVQGTGRQEQLQIQHLQAAEPSNNMILHNLLDNHEETSAPATVISSLQCLMTEQQRLINLTGSEWAVI